MTEPAWKEKRKRREIRTSASQFETWNLCHRKWWLDKVRKLFIPTSTSQGFGTVLHAVVERWMMANDLGRDADGKPVEMYPQGWHNAFNKFTGDLDYACTAAEQDIIKKLVTVAIEEGVMERRPGRLIERQFNHSILKIKCPTCGGKGIKMIHRPDIGEKTYVSDGKCKTCNGDGNGTNITIMGFIDLELSDQIEDHKTTKNMKYAKSAAKLRENTQMLIYAKMHLLHLEERGEPLPPKITIRHNVFCKDPKKLKVRKTHIDVTLDEINKHWETIVQTALSMDAMRRTADDWRDIPDPPNLSTACNAYGGCPFLSICSGQESMNIYEKRLASKYNSGNNGKDKTRGLTKAFGSQTKTEERGSTMPTSFASKLAAKQAQKAASAGEAPAINPTAPAATTPVTVQGTLVAPVTASVPATVTAPAAAAQVPPMAAALAAASPATAPATNAPPWADPACTACIGIGFNTKGVPCRICDLKAPTAGRLQSTAFLLTPDGKGNIYWQNQSNDQQAGLSPLPVQTEAVQAEVRTDPVTAETPAASPPTETPAVTPPATPPVEEPAAPPVEEPAVETPAAPPAKKNDTKGPGRPKKSFILLVNCSVAKGAGRSGSGRNVIYLSEVMANYGAKMAEANGAASFFALDAFSRRDALSAAAPEIAAEFGTDIVVANSDSPDMRAFLDAIRPLAGMEIVANG